MTKIDHEKMTDKLMAGRCHSCRWFRRRTFKGDEIQTGVCMVDPPIVEPPRRPSVDAIDYCSRWAAYTGEEGWF